MSQDEVTPESFGHDVLGPIMAEFCLRLWSLTSQMERADDAALLFCARGGLRMQLVFERFLRTTGLPSDVRIAPLMVSRVVAIRPSLARAVREGSDTLLPVGATTIGYEFPGASLSTVARAMTGVAPDLADRWDGRFTPDGFAALLSHADGAPVLAALQEQTALFVRHLRDALGDRSRAVLVDTGLYGTTGQLLGEGVPDVAVSSALIARSFRPSPGTTKTFGLSVEAPGYSPLRRRTALLRYWHFVEWLFEPDLTSVRTFVDDRGVPRSNLEVPGWQDRLEPVPGTPFAGLLAYVESLGAGATTRVLTDADRAWREFRNAIIWPRRDHGLALTVGTRSHDFGVDGTWEERPWPGPVGVLRGSSMWRGGEIARSTSRLRLPLLTAVEAAYAFRSVKSALARVTSS